MLRDLEILSDIELEDTIELYEKKKAANEKYDNYHKYAKVLNELKELTYFTEEQYAGKLKALKQLFEIAD